MFHAVEPRWIKGAAPLKREICDERHFLRERRPSQSETLSPLGAWGPHRQQAILANECRAFDQNTHSENQGA
jgi:hypothetical protein